MMLINNNEEKKMLNAKRTALWLREKRPEGDERPPDHLRGKISHFTYNFYILRI